MLERRKDECAQAFAVAAAKPEKSEYPSPISLRVTTEERSQLKADAGDRTLSSYIRWRLLGDGVVQKRSRRPKRRGHTPGIDHVILAQLLGALGQSRLSSNLNQIARAANIGALPVSEELEHELLAACTDVKEMRDLLMRALGKVPA